MIGLVGAEHGRDAAVAEASGPRRLGGERPPESGRRYRDKMAIRTPCGRTVSTDAGLMVTSAEERRSVRLPGKLESNGSRMVSTPPTLSRGHPCSTAFLDETGAIAKDEIFAVGLVKSPQPSRVLRAVEKIRDRRSFYREFKFGDVTGGTVDLYCEVIDATLGDDDVEFFGFVAKRAEADPIERFGDHWAAYNRLAEQLVVASIRPTELMTVLADKYSAPDWFRFEESLRDRVNARLHRLAVVSCCRIDSKASDALQIADILIGATAYEFRVAAHRAGGHGPKAVVAAHLRERLGVSSCLDGVRSPRCSVQIYRHGSWTGSPSSAALPL